MFQHVRGLRTLVIALAVFLVMFPGILRAQMPAPSENSKPIDPQNFDMSVNPTADFYQYVNGGWMARNPIPADLSRWGSFNELQEKSYAVLHEILDDAAKRTDSKNGTNLQKVGDFYFSGMDSARIEAEGVKVLMPELNRIDEIKDIANLLAWPSLIAGLNMWFS